MSDFPEMEMMTDKPNIASAKNSAGPNFNAIFEMSGDKKVMTRAPMIPPLKEVLMLQPESGQPEPRCRLP